MVLPNGDAIWASDQERGDLFNGSAGALGTFGILTLLEVQLVPAKGKVVELQYHPVRSVPQAVMKSRKFCQENGEWDYVDGTMYSLESGAVITGNLVTEDADKPVTARYWGAGDNWYYSDVQEKLEKRPEGWTDAVPLEDYLFRYDRGGFWCGRAAFQDLRIPFNSWTRWLLDGRLRNRAMFNSMHSSGSISRSVIQDLSIPAKKLDDFVNHVTRELNIWPLWLCPIRSNAGRGLFQLSDTANKKSVDDLYINVGVWGINVWGYGLGRYDESIAKNRALEHKVHALGGYKWLYSQTFYTEEEFWNVYPREKYDALRKKYHATSLPTVYEKVRTDVEGERQFLSSWKSGQLYEIVTKMGAIVWGKK